MSQAYLSSDFGVELAVKKTGLTMEQLASLVGVYKKGPRKGKLKGTLYWMKCTHAGWHRTGRYDHDGGGANGFVCRFVGICFSFGIIVEKFREKSEYKWGADWTSGFPNSFDHDLSQAIDNKIEQIEKYKMEAV